MTTFQKIIKYLAMAFAIFLSISIITGICSALLTVTYFFSGNASDEMTHEYDITNTITSLSVNISAAELEIKTGDNFNVETNHKYLKCEEKDDVLKISETRKLFASYPKGMKVILTIPEEIVFDYVDISTGAGSVTIDVLSSNILDIDIGAGELNVGRLDALYKSEIDGGVGELNISFKEKEQI